MAPAVTFQPPIELTARQRWFVESESREVLFGGGVAAGKTTALLAAAFAGVDDPDYHALIAAPTSHAVVAPGGIIDVVFRWLDNTDVRYRFDSSTRTWTFPSGARVSVAAVSPGNVDRFRGLGLQFVGFDNIDALDAAPVVVQSPRWWKRFFTWVKRLWDWLHGTDETPAPPAANGEQVYELLRSRLRPTAATPAPRIAVTATVPHPWMELFQRRRDGEVVTATHYDNPAVDSTEMNQALATLPEDDPVKQANALWRQQQ